MDRFLFHTSALIGYISVLGLGLGLEGIRPAASQALPLEPLALQSLALEPAPLVAQSSSSTRWPGNRTGGGTRGCEIIPGTPKTLSNLKRSFIALAPQTNLGITTQSYPRLAWYIPPILS